MKLIFNLTRGLVAALAAGLLGACGGGGAAGSSGNPPSNPPANPSSNPPANPPSNPPANPPSNPPSNPPPSGPTLVLSNLAVAAEAWVTDYQGPLKLVQVSLPGQGSTTVYLGGTYSTNGIEYVDMGNGGPPDALRIVPRRPVELRPGTYTDVINVRACLEWPCVNHIAGSPQVITLIYTVSMPAVPPRLTLQHSSISLQGQVLDPGTPPDSKVDVVFNAGEATTWITTTLSSTSNGVSRATFRGGAVSGGHGGQVVIEMKPPASLGVGNFTDAVTVKACLDAACVNELEGSPATINVQYAISDSVPGPNGYRTRSVAVSANDVVSDEQRGLLYLSIASDSAYQDTIAVLDPASATFQKHAPVGGSPGALALSADGKYLYVALRDSGSVKRLLLPSLEVDLTIPLGMRDDGAQLNARELHVSPGDSRTLAVVRAGSDLPWDVAIFDDAVMRSQTAGGSTGPRASTIQWESAGRIFGVDSATSTGAAIQIEVDVDGAHTTASSQGVTSFDGTARHANGRMYMDRGRVFDPVTFAQIGSFPLAAGSTNAGLTLDAANGRAFLISGVDLRSFDLTTLAPIATVWLPRSSPNITTRMVRWGTNGLAILNYESLGSGTRSLLLLDGAFVRP